MSQDLSSEVTTEVVSKEITLNQDTSSTVNLEINQTVEESQPTTEQQAVEITFETQPTEKQEIEIKIESPEEEGKVSPTRYTGNKASLTPSTLSGLFHHCMGTT